jgi:branched-chain amino acid transport system substrate-binding protein
VATDSDEVVHAALPAASATAEQPGMELAPSRKLTVPVGVPAPPETVAEIRAANIQPEGYVLPAYAAMQVALAAVAAADSLASGSVTGTLDTGETDTVIGKVAFDAKGDTTLPFYRLFRFDGTRFVPVGDE